MSASPRNGTPVTPQMPCTGPLGDLDPAEFAGRSVITTGRDGGRGSRAAEALHEACVDAVILHGDLRTWAADGGAIVRDDGSPGRPRLTTAARASTPQPTAPAPGRGRS